MTDQNVSEQFLDQLSPSEAAKVLAAATDIAVLIDRDGTVLDVAAGSSELAAENLQRWVGKPWAEAATVESTTKLNALLTEAFSQGRTRWRQVNHPLDAGTDLPVQYTVLRLEGNGRALALGRDMRAISSMQQRLLDAQQLIEREYRDLRHSDLRYRMLFQMASEAVIIVDLASRRVIEANPAAVELLIRPGARLSGRTFPVGFDDEGNKIVSDLVNRMLTVDEVSDVRASIKSSGSACIVSGSPFRQERSRMGLIRIRPVDTLPGLDVVSKAQTSLLRATEVLPDAVAVTEVDGTILHVNAAFIEMAQLTSHDQAIGESIDRWLGRPGVDTAVLMVNLKERGTVSLFSTIMRSDLGGVISAEVSATVMEHGGRSLFAFTIRNIGLRLNASQPTGSTMLSSMGELTELVGRVPLKEIVRETGELIEGMCIETALNLTSGNRAAAAEMLGLSRQSLYVKMRRSGLAGNANGDEKES
ncbi:MAG: transcriptional regulator PpsR [Burkholderiaceae bacterium]